MAGESTREQALRGLIQIVDEARHYLKRIFVVFLIGLLGTIVFLRAVGFGAMQRQALSKVPGCGPNPAGFIPGSLPEATGCPVTISYIHPAEVILLQAKIGLVVGIILTLPMFLYYGRKPLKSRGIWPQVSDEQKRKYLIFFSVSSVFFFMIGVAYSYFVMIPFFINFVVSEIAVPQDIEPRFRISSLVNFILVYSLIFGISAELPLVMITTVKTKIVSYHFYRDKWRHFIIVAAIFSALATSPDPVTQLIVLGPVVFIYGVGLFLVRVFARKEIREHEEMREKMEKDEEEEGGLLGSVPSIPGVGSDSSDSGPESVETDHEPGGARASEDRTIEREGLERADSSPTAIQDVEDPTERDLMDRGIADIATSVITAIKSKGIRIGAVFLASTSLIFFWLMSMKGLKFIVQETVKYLPDEYSYQSLAVTLEPFEIVFLIVKLSLIGGIAVTLPMVFYYIRSTLVSEGVMSGRGSRFYYASRVLLVVGLFIGGVLVAYFGMIPLLVSALTRSMVEGDVIASYTIGDFVNFILTISFVFGVMAQMPAVMYILVSSRVMTYETLRDKWKHFTTTIFVLAAVITSPEPFTMIIIATPLAGFYLVSLGITRVLCHSTIKEVREDRRRFGLAEDGGSER